jgi:hypothetical protein
MRRRKGSRANPRTPDFTSGFSLTTLHSDAGKWMLLAVSRGTRGSRVEPGVHYVSEATTSEQSDCSELTRTRDFSETGEALLKALHLIRRRRVFRGTWPRPPVQFEGGEPVLLSSARSLEQPAGEIRGSSRAVGRDARREMINLEVPPMDAIMQVRRHARASTAAITLECI